MADRKEEYRTAPTRWKKDFVGRFKSLRTSQPPESRTHDRFAKLVRIARSTLTSWLSGDRAPPPKAYDLFLIGKYTGVSVDWLLFGTDVDGNPTSEPQFREQSRGKKALEDDLAVAVLREIRARGVEIPRAVRLSISRPKLLRKLVEIVEADLALLSRAVADEEPRLNAMEAILEAHSESAGGQKVALAAAMDWLADGLRSGDRLPTAVVSGASLGFNRLSDEPEIALTDEPAFTMRISGGPA